MMLDKLSMLLIITFLGSFISIQAQDRQPAQDSQVIQIEAQVIDARIELPQVQILDKRKVSDFDEVKVEKSFTTELSGKNEEVKFTPVTSGEVKRIKNVNALLNKRRF